MNASPELWLFTTCVLILLTWGAYSLAQAWLGGWRRYLRRVRAGRARQAAEWQDRHDAERRAAAEWVSRNCFWRGEQ